MGGCHVAPRWSIGVDSDGEKAKNMENGKIKFLLILSTNFERSKPGIKNFKINFKVFKVFI